MLEKQISFFSAAFYAKKIEELTFYELHFVLAKVITARLCEPWEKSREERKKARRAYYFSAEYLTGKQIYKNLMCLDLENEIEEILKKHNRSLSELEQIEDEQLGNGGLGRLSACFLDSAANLKLPLYGYGIFYRFGIFKQKINNGFQYETVSGLYSCGNAWEISRRSETVTVHFSDYDVNAVPFDMPVAAYGGEYVATLRLWQCESKSELDFALFNEQKYDEALKQKNDAENISRVLYPNDSTDVGKELRFRQEYFLASASLTDLLRKHKREHGSLDGLSKYVAIQLNDTHPVIAIPELIRLLENEGFDFDCALSAAGEIFCFTNHTVMNEALEKWSVSLIEKLCPDIARIIKKIDERARIFSDDKHAYSHSGSLEIISASTVNMAFLACFVCKSVNGVAELHTEILKSEVFKEWHTLFSQKFQNKTNGISQRRFLRLFNPRLSELITDLLSDEGWITELSLIKGIEKYAENREVLRRFAQIKAENKKDLSEYIGKRDGISFCPNFIVDAQIKRIHEYKRQLLNALCILEIYFEIKEKSLVDFYPVVFIFSGKAAPGYKRAKGIIKLINEIKRLVEADEYVSRFIKIIFASDYDVSYAEKIIPATDVSVQISTAGTEASGTGNMKLMLNGAVTLGTYDGANIEIVRAAGESNNYIFGKTARELTELKGSYSPKTLYENDYKIKRCLDALVDGTLSDGKTGVFAELYKSLLDGASWHRADNYFVLLDFNELLNARLRINNDYKNEYLFAEKCFRNTASAGFFSADRTVYEYAKDIWNIL